METMFALLLARYEAFVLENSKLQHELGQLSEKLAQETETASMLREDRASAWENAADLELLLTAAKDSAADLRGDLRAAKEEVYRLTQEIAKSKEEVYRLTQEIAKSKAIPADRWDGFADNLVVEDVHQMTVKPDVIYPDKTNVYWDNKLKRVKAFRDGTMCNLIEAKTAIENAARRACGI